MVLQRIWESRSLIQLFVINEIRQRYRSTILGFLWSILEPLLLLTVLYLVFSYLMKNPIENYQLYLLLGIVMWRMFSVGTSMGLQCLHAKAPILQKIYIKREIIPISTSITSFVIAIFEFSVFFVFIIALQFNPTFTIFILPLILILEFVLIVGISFFLSVLNVFYRDVQHIWTIILTAGFFASPILYQTDTLPENIRTILYINPMTPILDMAHDSVLFASIPNYNDVVYSILVSFSILFVGYFIFRRYQNKAIEEL